MNTPENRIWIEPPSSPETGKPVALLEPVRHPHDEVTEPQDPLRAIPARHLEDTGGNHLTALDDW